MSIGAFVSYKNKERTALSEAIQWGLFEVAEKVFVKLYPDYFEKTDLGLQTKEQFTIWEKECWDRLEKNN